ncbi:hypothetical protein BN1708_008546 [Verticillium longisporum]|uniref:Uncharacterized protein n=1 Tax=Verticillium longisporum TaxID=100787 RepID=A0A0G4N552_VERLO|nr:hypothetical protein BN1708_008546 [Verticillium longisporum]
MAALAAVGARGHGFTEAVRADLTSAWDVPPASSVGGFVRRNAVTARKLRWRGLAVKLSALARQEKKAQLLRDATGMLVLAGQHLTLLARLSDRRRRRHRQRLGRDIGRVEEEDVDRRVAQGRGQVAHGGAEPGRGGGGAVVGDGAQDRRVGGAARKGVEVDGRCEDGVGSEDVLCLGGYEADDDA